MSLNTYHIHIEGLVQGVGFRPFTFRLAKDFGLCGLVNNTTDGVHVQLNADEKIAEEFYTLLIQQAPALSKITRHSMVKIKRRSFSSFNIIESISDVCARLILTPDYAMCGNCKSELYSPNNRRYQYPFITCTQCGPRYSIIKSLPYDRVKTSMDYFEMCGQCREEYNNPENRRHYSQTNSCADCPVTMIMYSASGDKLCSDNEAIINMLTPKLINGKIIAVKGIGGYLLITDANNKESIKILRERKHRPSKPFALMFKDIDAIRQVAELNEREEKAIQEVVAPIVLVKLKESGKKNICSGEVAPKLSKIGVMTPYTPLFHLILEKFGKPVVATSANLSDAPIIYNDEDALSSLKDVADFIITNNREIVTPQDDSVIQFAANSKQKIIMRRSRGMAPSFFNYECNKNETVLATGAMLKSCFTYLSNGNTYISQYLGSTESYEAQAAYSKTVNHFFNLFNKKPEVVLTDKHPLYFSNSFAKNLAGELKVAVEEIQHHKAHFAAVLAENNLIHGKKNQQINLSVKGPLLGVIWDGTGLGDDGNIWGGEFFKYENNSMMRINHFDYFPFILGDKMAREPRISALATCFNIGMTDDVLKNKFTETEWKIYQKMLRSTLVPPPLEGVRGRLCSSVGRIFDAVSSLLNLCDKQSFEGEVAMLLEEQASVYFENNGWNIQQSYFDGDTECNQVPTVSLMQGIINDIQQKKSVQLIAAKFHYSLVHLIENVARNSGIKRIAFSGGVFLNGILVDLLHYHLGNKYQLYFHKELSPNDENISFGQMVYYDNNIDEVNKHAGGIESLKSLESLESLGKV